MSTVNIPTPLHNPNSNASLGASSTNGKIKTQTSHVNSKWSKINSFAHSYAVIIVILVIGVILAVVAAMRDLEDKKDDKIENPTPTSLTNFTLGFFGYLIIAIGIVLAFQKATN